MRAFHILETPGMATPVGSIKAFAKERIGQIVSLNDLAARQQGGVLERITQLAEVPRPLMFAEGGTPPPARARAPAADCGDWQI